MHVYSNSADLIQAHWCVLLSHNSQFQSSLILAACFGEQVSPVDELVVTGNKRNSSPGQTLEHNFISQFFDRFEHFNWYLVYRYF